MNDLEIILDFDGVMVNSFLYYLSHPLKTLNILVKAFANCLKERNIGPKNLVKNFLIYTKGYAEEIGREMIMYKDSGLIDFLYFLNDHNKIVYIVSSSQKYLIENFMRSIENSLKEKFDYRIIASSQQLFISSYRKIKFFNNKKIFSITDSENDFYLNKKSDFPIIKKSFLYFISRRKPEGFVIKNLNDTLPLLNILFNEKT